jgi:hypothetical protein
MIEGGYRICDRQLFEWDCCLNPDKITGSVKKRFSRSMLKSRCWKGPNILGQLISSTT